MWLIKFRFGCIVIEQRTARNMNDPVIVADVIAKATIDVIQNYFNIYDQMNFDGVTFEWFDDTQNVKWRSA